MVGEHHLAQDLLQEALLKTYVAWPRIRDVARAEAYTRRVIVTTSVSWRRRRSFHERPAEPLPEPAATRDETDSVVMQDALWLELQALPPRQRAAVVLRYYHDLTEVQTAELMGCSVGTVKSQVFAALGTLRRRMGDNLTLLSPDDEVVSR
jgi:RNA polymerase sigma-70 factor (sigma-E family)